MGLRRVLRQVDLDLSRRTCRSDAPDSVTKKPSESGETAFARPPRDEPDSASSPTTGPALPVCPGVAVSVPPTPHDPLTASGQSSDSSRDGCGRTVASCSRSRASTGSAATASNAPCPCVAALSCSTARVAQRRGRYSSPCISPGGRSALSGIAAVSARVLENLVLLSVHRGFESPLLAGLVCRHFLSPRACVGPDCPLDPKRGRTDRRGAVVAVVPTEQPLRINI